MRKWILGILVLLIIGSYVSVFLVGHDGHEATSSLVGVPASMGEFQKAEGPIQFSFPLDHGPHPKYQTEWWYYTGNLQTNAGRHFGYQLTFFRRALSAEPEIRSSFWSANQVFMAHFAITDTEGEQYLHKEQLERGIPGLAGARGEPTFSVWLHDWEVRQTGENTYHLIAQQPGATIDLTMTDLKGPIPQGDAGYSQKGDEPGNASYYYSQTRLRTSGKILVGQDSYPVNGFSWMDHEFSTSALGEKVVGWDWFSLQLDDNSELMLFMLRKLDGSLDNKSSGTLIRVDGSTRRLKLSDFAITPQKTWQSPDSGATYPSTWKIGIPSEEILITIAPTLANQEFQGFFTYWEGSVKAEGHKKGNPVSGFGYVELTGYSSSMQGQF